VRSFNCDSDGAQSWFTVVISDGRATVELVEATDGLLTRRRALLVLLTAIDKQY